MAEGTYRLGTEWINWYLVEAADGVTVVDSGYPAYFDQLPAALRSLGREPGDVRAVVLTHYHADHVGGAERIRRELGAVVLAPAEEAGGIRGDERVPLPGGLLQNLWRPTLLRYMAHTMRSGGAKPPPVHGLETYRPGQTLEVPGRPEVVATPGHSRGHCSLLFGERGVLMAADALGSMSLISNRTGPQLPPFNEDAEQAARSLQALEDLEAEVVTFGHGDPFRGSPAEAVRQARAPG